MRPRGSRGFSAIELLVVISIAALLLGWGTPRLASLVNHYRLDGAAWDLATDLQKIRLRAIQEGKSFRVLFSSSNRTYQVQSQNGASWVNDGPAQAIEDSGKITLTASANPVFTTRGILQTGTASMVTLQGPVGGQRLVWVQLQGQVYVQ